MGEDYLVDRKMPIHAKDGETHMARNGLAVGHNEGKVSFFFGHTDAFQGGLGDPRVIAARIDEQFGNTGRTPTVDVVGDYTANVEGTHLQA